MHSIVVIRVFTLLQIVDTISMLNKACLLFSPPPPFFYVLLQKGSSREKFKDNVKHLLTIDSISFFLCYVPICITVFDIIIASSSQIILTITNSSSSALVVVCCVHHLNITII